jgi:hypothetical protein
LDKKIIEKLDKSGIKVDEYLTQLPDRELLKQKLHQAVIMAKEQMRRKNNLPGTFFPGSYEEKELKNR